MCVATTISQAADLRRRNFVVATTFILKTLLAVRLSRRDAMVGRAVERRRGSDLSTFDPPPSSISKTSRLQRLSGGSAGCARGSEIAVNQYFHLLCDLLTYSALELKGDVGRGWVPLPLKLSVCLPPVLA